MIGLPFDCGDMQMNEFLQRFARQSHEQNAAKTFCAVDNAIPNRIFGFYTVAPSSVAYEIVTASTTRGLARHDVPGFKLACLATDRAMAGQGLGGQLLVAAASRCLRLADEGGGILLTIDAKSERAANWYASFGAEPLQEKPLTLVMPLTTFAPDLRAKGLL